MERVPRWDALPEHSHLVIWHVISLFIHQGSWQHALRTGLSGCVGVAGRRQHGMESRRTAVTSDQVPEEEEEALWTVISHK